MARVVLLLLNAFIMIEASVRRFSELDTVYAGLVTGTSGETYKVRGIVLEIGDEEATIAVASTLACFDGESAIEVDGTKVGFVSVPLVALSRARPKGWANEMILMLAPWPDKNAVMDSYNALKVEPSAAVSSSEVEQSFASAAESRNFGAGIQSRARSSQAASSAAASPVPRMPAALQGLLQGSKGLVAENAYDDFDSEEGDFADPMMRPVLVAPNVAHAALPP
jgi:hypothetical protein